MAADILGFLNASCRCRLLPYNWGSSPEETSRPCIEPSISHLYSCLSEPYFARQLLPGEDIRVVSLVKDCLQLLELLEGESRPVPPLLPPQEGLVVHVWGVAEGGVCKQVRSVLLLVPVWQLTWLVRAEWKFKRRKSDRSSGNKQRVGIVEHCNNTCNQIKD